MTDDRYQGKYRIDSVRLKDFDYSSGVFFVTICVRGMERVFGDEFVVMPDHMHGILRIVETHCNASVHEVENKFGPQKNNLASIIRGFKGAVRCQCNKEDINFQWQPKYYEKIIRSQKALENIRQYIKDNPKNYK